MWRLRQIRHLVFARQWLTSLGRKSVEMSEYIDIEDYDQHEEEHAYYLEMMEKMLSIFSQHRRRSSKVCRVLELGAGTGIFTKRLAQIPNVKVVAVELDWACVKRLEHNLKNRQNVEIVNGDSCTYNPSKPFDYIFSSFSDHHIKPEDKDIYFRNIKRNLMPGGLFLVGDEFLRPYTLADHDAWQAALEAYHNHIIEIAEKAGHAILAHLEREALKSGLEKQGDFKLPCEQYEATLSAAGFAFSQEKIGPLERDDVGGVYVYTAWPNV